jgi:DNA-binding NtrC family response regulator
VRELKHAIERYVILPDVDMVLAELTPMETEMPRMAEKSGILELSVETGELGKGKIPLKPIAARAAEEAEKKVILRILHETRWNRRRAAARLDICYKTLLNKLQQWRLEGDGGPAPAGNFPTVPSLAAVRPPRPRIS